MPKALSVLTLFVALALGASGCGAEAEVTLASPNASQSGGSTSDTGSATTDSTTDVDTNSSTDTDSDDAVAAGDAGNEAVSGTSVSQTCNYLGIDSWDDMQIEVWFTSELDDVSDAEVVYSVLDAAGTRVYGSSNTIELVAPGETVRLDIDTLTEPDGSDRGYECQIDAVNAQRSSRDLILPNAGENCRFVEVDSWGDIQVQLEFTPPSNGEFLIAYAVRSGDGVRIVSRTAFSEPATQGQLETVDEDTLSDLPDGVTEGELSCEILSLSDF